VLSRHFVIFDTRAHWRSVHSDAQDWASECPDVKNYKWQLNPVWDTMLYSYTHMAKVGVKGLKAAAEQFGAVEILSAADRQ